MRRRFHVTYETVTPESAERGDTADLGFLTPAGRVSLDGLWGEAAGAVKAECALTLVEAFDLFGARFHKGYLEVEADSFRWPEYLTVSYVTGEVERLALHLPPTITGASFRRLHHLLEAH